MAKLIEQNDYRLLSHEAGSGASWTGIKTKSLGTQSPAEKISPWQLGAATKSRHEMKTGALGALPGRARDLPGDWCSGAEIEIPSRRP
jgi:hypothetical protein